MSKKDSSLKILEKWYEGLPSEKGFRVRGAIAAALQVLEKLKTNYSLDLRSHLTGRQGQVSEISGQFLAQVLLQFDENRVFLREGGRTNRGVIGYVDSLLTALVEARLENLPDGKRNEIITALQLFLVEKIREYHGQQRIEIEYDPSKTTSQTISDLLTKTKETGKDGPVAQYLVGAKLALRFPDRKIGNESYSTADGQLDRPGDFYVGDTAFHVTVTPGTKVIERCRENLQNGLRVYLLVPLAKVEAARQLVELERPGRISVESIETFVGQNLDELSTFTADGLLTGFKRLVDMYNRRVEAVETNKSLKIKLPKNLL